MNKDLSDFMRKMEQVIEDMKAQRLHDTQHFEKLIRKLEDRCATLEKKWRYSNRSMYDEILQDYFFR